MPGRNVLKTDIADSYYHVYARGHGRQQIFREAADYLMFLSIFERYLSTKELTDKDGKCISAQSHKMLLPEFHQGILKNGQSLGEYVQQFLAENPDEKSQEIGNIIRFRKPFIEAAIRLALKQCIE